MTHTARLDITDVYGELHGSVVILPNDFPEMEPIDEYVVDRTNSLIGERHPNVDQGQPALRDAELFFKTRRWQMKGEWRPTEDGYTVSVERA